MHTAEGKRTEQEALATPVSQSTPRQPQGRGWGPAGLSEVPSKQRGAQDSQDSETSRGSGAGGGAQGGS